MTPEEWNRCTDPAKMLKFLSGKPSDRTLRLFACACFRRLVPLLTNQTRFRRARTTPAFLRRALKAVTVGERYADGAASPQELEAARRSIADGLGAVAWTAYHAVEVPVDAAEAAQDAVLAACWALGEKPAGARTARREWRRWQRATIQEMVGNPFCPAGPIAPSVLTWHDGAVRRLAESIYESRRFDDLPVLADLLEEAGLTDAGLLRHLRGPGPHALGCHALDAVLGK
jgi:hypothetical protein